MKKLMPLFLACAFALSANLHAAERFYGKITSINHNQKEFTVHNNKKNADATFQWDEATQVSMNKKSMATSELKVGQFLMVSFVSDNNLNKAQKVSVRTPFKKSQS
jgi:hypothetical protein